MDRKAMERVFRPFARTGYAARGLVFLVIGIFAAYFAIGDGEILGSKDALQKLLGGSGFGTVVAIGLMIGLVAYSVWRFIQSIFDTDDHGLKPKGLAIRGGLLASCFTYAALALYTFSLWRGGANSDDSGGGVAQTMANFVGSTLAASILAAVFLGVAVAHLVKAYKRRYLKYMNPSPEAQWIVDPVSRTGLTARGIIFLVIAYLFGWRAISGGGEEHVGLADALRFIADLPAGSWLMGAVGIGLICFAAYSFAEAIWRRINVEDADAPG
ncbi:DUF1206 domain-containing protein [Notoacmeibacter sp. MSK16QG-6]|uniref:DUF1206 domain-containing protein n=1 Tax=Notoacmeibacter sp. MSK16QG-6 TaxID=2957982 RepID=UPI00209D5039|nr:DUF1206 domain-containing protein [Notoacmeibacter sp. MSK16QG-6]MCP1198547.1 DUF1206 domain-containing protein [Notoacmeibacter sp. MSK16QG-6]